MRVKEIFSGVVVVVPCVMGIGTKDEEPPPRYEDISQPSAPPRDVRECNQMSGPCVCAMDEREAIVYDRVSSPDHDISPGGYCFYGGFPEE